MNLIKLIGFYLVTILVVFLVTQINLQSNRVFSLSVLLRILINYFQVVSMASNFKLNWPSALQDFFDSIAIITVIQEQIAQMDCFFHQTTDGYDRLYFKKSVLGCLLPADPIPPPCTGMATSLCLLAAKEWRSRKAATKKNLRTQLVSTFVVIIFMLYPTLSRVPFGLLNCYKLDNNEQWLQGDFQVRCWQSEHLTQFFLIGLPVFLVWVIGMPLVALRILYKNRKNLQ